jgi:hypothetical protein
VFHLSIIAAKILFTSASPFTLTIIFSDCRKARSKPETMQTERIFTSHGEEKELLEEEEEEEYGGMTARRHKACFHFGPKASLAISFALLLSLLFNLYHGYSSSYSACVADSQLKPGLVTQPSYC